MGAPLLLGGQGAGVQWFCDRPVRHEPRGHDGLVLPGRRAQALGGGVRRLQPRAAARSARSPRRWPDGSGRRSTRSPTSRDSRCAFRASAARSSPGGRPRRCSLPAAEIYAALERGVIDASEWIGPHDDMKLGLQNTARYYYYPGWHEPGTVTEFGFNRKAYEALPVDLRRTLDHAAAAVQVYGLTDYHAKNAIALERLKTEFKGKVEMLQFPAAGAARSQEAGGRGRPGRIREDPHGAEGARVLHEVPGAGGPLGPRRRGRLPPVRRFVTAVFARTSPLRRARTGRALLRRRAHRARRRSHRVVPDRRPQRRVGGEPSDGGRTQGRAQGAWLRRRSRRDVRHPLHRGQARHDAGRRRGPRQGGRRPDLHEPGGGHAGREGRDEERTDRVHAGGRSGGRRHRRHARPSPAAT